MSDDVLPALAHLSSNTAASRLEQRLRLEAAVEVRWPKLLARKPVFGTQPLDLYALHQAVLRFGGYRKVRAWGGGGGVGLGGGGRGRALPPHKVCPHPIPPPHPPHRSKRTATGTRWWTI